MRVLHLTPELPYAPGGSGGSTRQFHLLRELVERGHDVTVVAPVRHDQHEGAAGLRSAGIRLVHVERPRSRVAESLRAMRDDPRLVPRLAQWPLGAWEVGVFWADLRPLAEREIATAAPDVVVVEHDAAAAWAADLGANVPTALTLHNVSHDYYWRRAASAAVAKPLLRAEAARFHRFAGHQLRNYSVLIAVSEPDRDEIVRQLPGARVTVVPNGVDIGHFAPTREREGSPVLVFTGSMNHPPNSEGIRWFAREVWPRVAAEHPDLSLKVVGRLPGPEVNALGRDPRIEVTGAVSDVRPFFSAATAVVVPLLSGGGTRLKVLDAMAAGRAVVSTSIGCAGIEVVPGRDVLVADGVEAFAAATSRVLNDTKLRSSLAAAGRTLVEERYDWSSVAARLESLLEELAQGASR
jgi:glycosyltransferase involved in cell wall biosynthesis